MNYQLKVVAATVTCLTIMLSGCSSQKVVPEAAVKKPAAQNKKITNLDKAFIATKPVKPVVAKPVKKAKPAPKTVTVAARKPVPVARQANWGRGRAAELTGDFAHNQQTHAFINMMVTQHGFDRGYLNHVFSNTQATAFLQKMAYSDAKPRKRTGKSRKGSWTRYRNLFLTEKTIQQGVQFWRQNRVALRRAEQAYGVPQEYILGIIGVETRYGGNVGKNRAIDALATMGFNNARRGKYFQSELKSYLLMARKNGMDPLQPMASYAGALGLCQFMPSNIGRYGVDHDRNGTCNLWTPGDAIGSVANYFKKHGWRTGRPVAVRATTEGSKYTNIKSSYKRKHSLSNMEKNGVYPMGHIDQTVRFLRMSTYSGDEIWLAGHNFYVITRYNHSSKYAMAVHQLAQAIKPRISGTPTRVASLD